MNSAIRILSTGGTIDASPAYNPIQKCVFGQSYLPQMLSEAHLRVNVVLEPLFQKDSKDITEEDRNTILERCLSAEEQKIVITHGSDTLADTAKYLGTRIPNDKTVVLVGAFVPFSQDRREAMFNLSYAMGSVQHLTHGVWVCMGGKTFSWDNVQKNFEKQIFEELR